MCGILGSINLLIESKHLNLLKHRGPDDYGENSFCINNTKVQFLHRRLSIVDLSEMGKQPMFSHDQKSCIILNGEIYNHLELKNDIISKQFNGHSDTETLINFFRSCNIEDNLTRINGIFAFAYLDLENETLYLARDRFGVKPLYYYNQGNELLFSSELRPLKEILSISISKGVLMNSLRMRYSPSPATIYENIKKVEPGQLLKFKLGKDIAPSKMYFVQKSIPLGSKNGDIKKLAIEYGVLFEKAVTSQLMSDVEVGIFLSGGIDSALIAAIAKKNTKSSVKAFTVGFYGDDQHLDEINPASHTARVLGLDHYYKKINFSDLLTALDQIIEIVEEPIGTTSIIPMFYLSKLASSKVKVILSGQGADEPLGGYRKYRVLSILHYLRFFRNFLPRFKSIHLHKSEHFRRLFASIKSLDNFDSYREFNSIYSCQEALDLINVTEQNIIHRAMQKRKMTLNKPGITEHLQTRKQNIYSLIMISALLWLTTY